MTGNVVLALRGGAAHAKPPGMRTSLLSSIVAVALASCASKTARSQAPAADAHDTGGPHHHCAGTVPPRPTPYELAIAIPYDETVADRIAPEERAAFEAARPTFVRYCVRCHASGTKKVKRSTLDHLDMTSYPFATRADDVAALVRTVVGAGGGAPSMPLVGRGCLDTAEVDAIAAWADAFQRVHSTAEERVTER